MADEEAGAGPHGMEGTKPRARTRTHHRVRRCRVRFCHRTNGIVLEQSPDAGKVRRNKQGNSPIQTRFSSAAHLIVHCIEGFVVCAQLIQIIKLCSAFITCARFVPGAVLSDIFLELD